MEVDTATRVWKPSRDAVIDVCLAAGMLFGITIAANSGYWVFQLGYAPLSSLDIMYQFALAFAAIVTRRRPNLSCALSLALLAILVGTKTDIYLIYAVPVFSIYSAAKSGTTTLRWLVGISIAAWSALGTAYMVWTNSWFITIYIFSVLSMWERLLLTFSVWVFAYLLPFVLGTVVRLTVTRQHALAERDEAALRASEAQELADLRSQHAKLARDVHDVVGHSLAVIAAQADSVRFLPEDANDEIRAAAGRISGVARSSLAEVRTVLSSTLSDVERPMVRSAESTRLRLGSVIDQVSNTGRWVRHSEHGIAVSLPDETVTQIELILREALTNALKHSDPSSPIDIDLRWEAGSMGIEVSNRILDENRRSHGAGLGLINMRERATRIGASIALTEGDKTNGLFRVALTAPIEYIGPPDA